MLTETKVHVNMKFVQLWSRDLQIYLTMITYYIKPRHRLHACCIGWHSWKAITNSLSCLNHSHGKRKTSSTPWTSTDPIALRSNGLTPRGGGGGEEEEGWGEGTFYDFTPGFRQFQSGSHLLVVFFFFCNILHNLPKLPPIPLSSRHLRNPGSRLLYSQVPAPQSPSARKNLQAYEKQGRFNWIVSSSVDEVLK